MPAHPIQRSILLLALLAPALSGCLTVEAQQQRSLGSDGSLTGTNDRRSAVRPADGWWTDPDPAFDRAGRAGRPVLFFFTSENSPPCQAMQREVLPEPRVRDALEQAEPVRVNVDERPELAGSYRIEQLPTFVLVTPRGEEYDRFTGFLPPGAFVETLQAALDPALSIPNLIDEIQRHPENLQAHWLLAQKYARDRNREGLDEALDAMRRADPENRKGYLDNAAYLELMTTLDPRQPADGVRAAERFLEEFPDSEFADEMTMTLAQLQYQLGRKSEAIDLLEAFPRRYPDSPLAPQVRSDLREMKR